ncbi:hypothetical protein RJ639_010349 [Escallonia herrerae]|uniref:GUN4-like domain-containing protein n=1 Tax=Escallonia herrerae TaxID=1293975 RepID=A0AA88VRV9_9ASTE|nr:hypothetical protein RJ639_010349 [Escallonia herrerae]
MATNSLQSLHHHNSLLRRLSIDSPPYILSSTTLFLKPTSSTTTNPTSLSSITFSLSSSSSSSSSTTATSPTSPSTSETLTYDLLQQHLSAQNFREADEETRRLLIALAGEAAVKRGYVFFSEVQFISETDLRTIDELWRQHSDNRFGYSVQKKVWNKANHDFTNFFIRVGWMKKLDTEVAQYNYRAFPNEFIWELNDDTPVGHLPLTNALRGTQLLSKIFCHPAFDAVEEDEGGIEIAEAGSRNGSSSSNSSSSTSKPLSKSTVFKPDYSF